MSLYKTYFLLSLLFFVPESGVSDNEAGDGKKVVVTESEDSGVRSVEQPKGDCWDSVRLLCLHKLDLSQAIDIVVDKFPAIAGSFGVCCFHGDLDKVREVADFIGIYSFYIIVMMILLMVSSPVAEVSAIAAE